ncbi:MAG: YihY/virulence factor BrkB family protein [Lentisphaeria bacterium]|nr:YihY/virulence factor BrkB family protein [Lentisphaeria bacterium]
MISRLKRHMAGPRQFLVEGVWQIDLAKVDVPRRVWYSFLRGLVIVCRGFIDDKCALQASALTFITLMAAVPTLALLFAVAKGMGFEQHLKHAIRQYTGGTPPAHVAPATPGDPAAADGGDADAAMPGNSTVDTTMPDSPDTVPPDPAISTDAIEPGVGSPPEAVAPTVFDKALEDFLDRTGTTVTIPSEVGIFVNEILDLVTDMNLTALGIVGLLLTLYSVVRVLGKIESTFNIIWGIQTGRTWVRRLADFSLVLIVVPLLIVVVTMINAVMSSEMIVGFIQERLNIALGLYQFLLGMTGAFVIILAFALLYLCLPNTQVRIMSAIVGGACGGLLWLGWQWMCIRFQLGITNMNAIYGAFAGLPISLFWLQVNWVIVLLGAEISFAYQNIRTYVHESQLRNLTFSTRLHLAHYIVHEVCRVYRDDDGPWQALAFQQQYNVPIRLLRTVIHDLTEGNVLLEVEGGGLVPARDPATLSLSDVEKALYGACSAYIENLNDRIEAPSLDMRQATEEAFLESLAKAKLASILPASDPSAAGGAE